jgi:hypothetical protein
MLVLTRYTQKRGLSIGILPSFSGYMTVVKIWDYPTERLPKEKQGYQKAIDANKKNR